MSKTILDKIRADYAMEIESHRVTQEELEQLGNELDEAKAENRKLNLILFHRENGLSHPDLQVEIDKSKFAELQAELALLKERIETALSYLPECPQKAIGFLKGGE